MAFGVVFRSFLDHWNAHDGAEEGVLELATL